MAAPLSPTSMDALEKTFNDNYLQNKIFKRVLKAKEMETLSGLLSLSNDALHTILEENPSVTKSEKTDLKELLKKAKLQKYLQKVDLSSFIKAGDTLRYSLAKQMAEVDASVVGGITVTNYTKWQLVLNDQYLESGEFATAPRSVRIGEKEVIVGSKKSMCPAGFVGSAVWKVGDEGCYISIMWSVPYIRTFYSNTLAVGIRGNYDVANKTYEQMYYDNNKEWFGKKKYDSKKDIVKSNWNGKLCIVGSMGISQQTKVKVTVFPCDNADFAPKIRNEMPIDVPNPLFSQNFSNV